MHAQISQVVTSVQHFIVNTPKSAASFPSSSVLTKRTLRKQR